MIKLMIIADDFTGALDTGVQFSKTGIATMVAAQAQPDFASVPPQIQVLVADTKSRHVSPDAAFKAVRGLACAAVAQGIAYIYKKTDSTLRGNIGAEIDAVMDACGGQPAMFVPAFPKAGRTTAKGRQYVYGVPLEETAFAADPLNPTMTGDIRAILRAQTNASVKLVKPDTGEALNERNTIYVFDASEEEDLHKAGMLLYRQDKLQITAGCAGFAEHLARLLPFERHDPEVPALPAPVLLVCGSVNEHSMRQLRHAEELGFDRLSPSAAALTDASFWDITEGRRLIREAARKLDCGGRLIIESASPDGGRLPAESSGAVVKSLGALTARILDGAQPCTLVIFGGDTAMGIMAEANCTGLTPVDEIEPGVALSVMHTRLGDIPVISKAGGLGSDHVLQNIDAIIRRNRAI